MVKCTTAKKTRSLNILQHSLYTYPSSVKAAVYRCIVHPILEYASLVWYLYSFGDINQLESVQCRAARWVCGSQWNPVHKHWPKSSDYCINQLEWPSLHQRQNYFAICQVHNILNHRSAISFSQYFPTVNRHPSNPSALGISTSTINPYSHSFFVNSPFLWNNIPANILQITNMKVFCVAPRHFLFLLSVSLYVILLFICVAFVFVSSLCILYCC